MRFSTVSVALLAGFVAAAPQAEVSSSVQPISQISDGQIQAPPATATASVPVAPSAPVVSAPSEVPAVSSALPTGPTAVPPAPVAPTTPIVPGVNATSGVVPSAGSTGVTGTGTGRPTSSPTQSSPAEQSTAAAAGNIISLGGLAVAVVAAVFA